MFEELLKKIGKTAVDAAVTTIAPEYAIARVLNKIFEIAPDVDPIWGEEDDDWF